MFSLHGDEAFRAWKHYGPSMDESVNATQGCENHREKGLWDQVARIEETPDSQLQWADTYSLSWTELMSAISTT